jgi:hypothetical protein
VTAFSHWPKLHDYRHSRAVILCTWRPPMEPAQEAAHQSAERLASLLTGPMCGWPQDRLMLLDNESQPDDLANTLTEAFGDVKDIAFFYYIGPAQVVDGQFFITLTQPPGGESESGGLPLDALTKALANSKAATKVVILDWHFRFEEVVPDDFISAVAHSDAYIIGALIEAGRPWFDPYANESYLSKYVCDIVENGVDGNPPPRLSITLVLSEFMRLTDQRPRDFVHRPVPGAARFELAHNVRRPPQLRDVMRGWLIGVPGWLAAFQATTYARWTCQWSRMRTWGARSVDRAREFACTRSAVEESPQRDPELEIEEPKRWTRGRISLLVVGACVVFGLAAVALHWLLPHPPQPVRATTTSYGFTARQYSDGLVVMRHWMLSGPDGSELTERLIVSNIGGTALHLPFKEPIPAAIVDPKTVQFSPEAPKTIDAGHVFEWDVSLAAGGHEVITYNAKVAPRGVAHSRIELMARRFDTAAAKLPPPVPEVHLRLLMMTAATIRVTAGKSVRLALTGTMSNGMKASAAILAMVKWIVANPEIAKVNAFGKLTGLSPGRTRVTARSRGERAISASALVIIKGGTSTSSPKSPSPTGSSSPSKTPTKTPTSSPPTITPGHTLP